MSLAIPEPVMYYAKNIKLDKETRDKKSIR